MARKTIRLDSTFFKTDKSRIYLGDCQDVLLSLFEENTIDAIVTDPPYGLRFMNKKWDYGVPSVKIWEQCLRVLKPGAHLLCFCGTRTQHRMAVAIEDAGFEIRDVIAWHYGCLSDDTEILIDGKWEPYHKAIAGSLVLCYDVEHEKYIWQNVQDLFVYNYDDTAFRIVSDETDQIVTRNHRCIVERDGSFVFRVAEEAARQHKARVPILEDLQGLLRDFSMPNKRTGVKKQDVLHRLRQGFDKKTKNTKTDERSEDDINYMPSVWKEGMETKLLVTTGKGCVLFKSMWWSRTWKRMEKTCAQRSCMLDKKIYGVLFGKNEWSKQSSMERWGYLFQKAWKLCFDQICAMSNRVFRNGSQGRIYNGTPVDCGGSHGQVFTKVRSCSSCESRSTRQQDRKLNAFCKQSRPQTVRGKGRTTTSLATIVPVHYKGIVWCVRVPTGAFVVRRNGKVFVTGNSGFPKSRNIGKAIDKEAGVERKVVGINQLAIRKSKRDTVWTGDVWGDNGATITAPATEQAKKWDGYGTALKPATEFITIARKPISEKTIAQNVLKHGTGAMNIDGCRVETKENLNGGGYSPGDASGMWKGEGGGFERVGKEYEQPTGRWPANLILSHSEGCKRAGTRKTKGRSINRFTDGAKPFGDAVGCKFESEQFPDDEIEIWECVDGCPIKEMDKQSENASRFFYCAKANKKEKTCGGRVECKHPTVKPIALMRYLVRLVTPKGATVLDPFCGTGSTLIAAKRNGCVGIGIDSDRESCFVARERLQCEEDS